MTPQRLPFAWPDQFLGDYRPLLEFDVAYAWPYPARCTYCMHSGAARLRTDLVKIKTRRSPKGWLETRCLEWHHPDRAQRRMRT